MIVWVASVPRSGNTFFRILIHEFFGVPTYSGFSSGDDISGDYPEKNPTGHKDLPDRLKDALRSGTAEFNNVLEELDSSDEIFFIKTHLHVDGIANNHYRAIVLVRDGRDVLISFAWYLINVQHSWRRLAKVIPTGLKGFRHPRGLIQLLAWVFCNLRFILLKSFGYERKVFLSVISSLVVHDYWTKFNCGWIDRDKGKTALIKFEELIRDPAESVKQALKSIDVDLKQKSERALTFDELKQIHPTFFRSGKIGQWKNELPEQLLVKFIDVNREGLKKFGYLE